MQKRGPKSTGKSDKTHGESNRQKSGSTTSGNKNGSSNHKSSSDSKGRFSKSTTSGSPSNDSRPSNGKSKPTRAEAPKRDGEYTPEKKHGHERPKSPRGNTSKGGASQSHGNNSKWYSNDANSAQKSSKGKFSAEWSIEDKRGKSKIYKDSPTEEKAMEKGKYAGKAERKSSEYKPRDSKSYAGKSSYEGKTSEGRKSADDKPKYGKTTDSRPKFSKSSDDKPKYGKSTDSRSNFGKTADDKPKYGKSKDSRSNFSKSSDDRPKYGQSTEGRNVKRDDAKTGDWKIKDKKTDSRFSKVDGPKGAGNSRGFDKKPSGRNQEGQKPEEFKSKDFKPSDYRAKDQKHITNKPVHQKPAREVFSKETFHRYESQTVTVKCDAVDFDGKGLIKINGEPYRIAGLYSGEEAIVEVTPKGKYTSVRLVQINRKSKYRIEPLCECAGVCGGCQLQHLSYEGQLAFKQKNAENLLNEFGSISPIMGMEEPMHYRNKVHSTLSYDENGKIISGIYEEDTHNVTMVGNCMIQDERANAIIKTITELMPSFRMLPFNEDTQKGFLRHIMIRTGHVSGQIMVVLIVGTPIFQSKNHFIQALVEKHPEITTMILNVNKMKTSMVLGNQETILYGPGYIEDTLCDTVFRISPKSFYQVNPIQTEKLYNKAIELADLKGDEIVLDAYSGIGTISLIVSKKVEHVVGVELNKDAVRDAISNAKRNKITNARFYQGDAGEFLRGVAEEKEQLDVVFMDPPRSGSDDKFLKSLLTLKPEKVVYISCNPVTLARDLKVLTDGGYKVKAIQPVDMFPHTHHVEAIVLMTRSGSGEKK